MASKDSRPVNLALTEFSFPITAWASIGHRACAVMIWVGLGISLYTLHLATASSLDFDRIAELLQQTFWAQFIAWGLLSAFGYYCCGTIKHLIQEMGYCEDFAGGKKISWLAIVGGVIISILAGVYLWA